MKKRIVIALGGNALGNNLEEQRLAVVGTASAIADLIEQGNEVIVVHGNGPQVGMISLAMEYASKTEAKTPHIPLAVCGAMSQGYIGLDLQSSIRSELIRREIPMPVSTIISQVVVDKNDPAFQNPTKPIGAFYSKEEADEKEKQGLTMVEDSGRGYRQVVASPSPVDIVEKDTVMALVAANQVVIACGGGGIPVVVENENLIPTDAVIDKDKAAAKLAEIVDADMLIILTAVPKIAINFGKPNEQWLDSMDIKSANRYIKEGHFAKGSMLPKVEAAVSFVEAKPGREALVAMLSEAGQAVKGEGGTRIYR